MQGVLTHPPKTIMELYKMLPEGTLAEIINGALYMSPAPFHNHQAISMNLSTEINIFLRTHKLGKIFAAPFDVYLDEEHNAVQPDLIIVLDKNKSIIKEHIHGVPDMLIEILSPGSFEHDTVRKKNLYERFGVKEYWIINPQTNEAIGYELLQNKFAEIQRLSGKINSRLLDKEFVFDFHGQ